MRCISYLTHPSFATIIVPSKGAHAMTGRHTLRLLQKLGQLDFPPGIVHVLADNRALCKFVKATVDKWPDGHEWVSAQDLALITCAKCLEMVQGRAAQRRQ